MQRYILRRLISAIPTLLIIVSIAFFMMRLAPGGPFDQERNLPPEIEANVLKAYGLDKPVIEQYIDYVGGLLRGDFGPSFEFRDFTVRDLIFGGFPASLQLGSLALALAILFGIGFGAYAALHQNSRVDYAVMTLAMTGIAVPNFVMAPILTLILGVYLSLLPVAGWGDGAWINKVLPVVALALPQIAYISRLTRGSMVEVLNANYILTARAKGLPEKIVVNRHALKGTIFEVPGIGRYFVLGALNRDYPLVMGTVIFYAVLIIVLNLVVDLIYAWLDPKVRLE
jgi:oligopeptide transport system permease protein